MNRRRPRKPTKPRGFRRPREDDGNADFGVPIPGEILPQEQWAQTALKKLPPEGPLDFAAIFGRSTPLVIDLGCGNGRFTITSALARPDFNHLAIDILPMVLRYATRRANQRGLKHVRFAAIDAEELLTRYIAPGSVAEIHLYHPQPYRDADRTDERLLTGEFLALVWRSLEPAGLFVIQTDNAPYWNYLQAALPKLFAVEERPDPWPDAPAGRTRREIYGRQKGLPIFRAVCRPQRELSAEEIAAAVAEIPQPRFRA
jgi:tRNA (guanine-N7-)-methyltransferase